MGAWRLAGRGEELEAVDDAFDARDCSGVVLVGPAGVGKSRLAEEIRARRWPTARTMHVIGTQASSSVPLAAFATVLPDLRSPDPTALLREAATAILEDPPAVVIADDAHWLDAGSIALLRRLAIEGGVSLVITVRSDVGTGTDLSELWRDDLLERIDLEPLEPEAIQALIRELLGTAVAGDTLTRLATTSGGIPLYARELTLGAVADGRLRQVEHTWLLGDEPIVAGGLVDLIEDRLAGLDDDRRELLQLVALGEPLTIDVLQPLAALTVLVDLEEAGYLRSEQAADQVVVRTAHPLYGEVLRTRMTPLARRRCHARLADAWSARADLTARHPLQVARHRLDSGGALSVEEATRAARAGRARFDLVLAERCARAGIDAGGGLPSELLLAQIVSAAGRAAEGEQLLVALGERVTSERDRAWVAMALFDNLSYLQSRHIDAILAGAKAEEQIGDVQLRAALTARRAFLMAAGGWVGPALQLVDPILDQVSGVALAWVAMVVAFGHISDGQTGRGLEAMARIEAVDRTDEAAPNLPQPAFFDYLHTRLLVHAGRLDDADDAAQQALESTDPANTDEGRMWLCTALAAVARLRGRPREAATWADEALALIGPDGQGEARAIALAERAIASAWLGDLDAARQQLPAPSALPGASGAVIEPEQAEPWVLAAEGRLSDAVDALQSIAKRQRGHGTELYELLALLDLVRLGRADLAIDRLTAIVPVVETELAAPTLAWAEAAVAADGAALDAAAEALAELGLQLCAAEAAADAAAAHRDAGDRRRSTTSWQRANELAGCCDGARTPALRRAMPGPVALSPREQEVALLATQGCSNREIAERLGTAKRTVDNQLQRIYEKLGIAGRAALADALQALDTP